MSRVQYICFVLKVTERKMVVSAILAYVTVYYSTWLDGPENGRGAFAVRVECSLSSCDCSYEMGNLTGANAGRLSGGV